MPDAEPTDTTQIKPTPLKAINPSGEEIEITEIVAAQPVPVGATPSSLSKTGSFLPLLGLALGAGASVREAARSIS